VTILDTIFQHYVNRLRSGPSGSCVQDILQVIEAFLDNVFVAVYLQGFQRFLEGRGQKGLEARIALMENNCRVIQC